MLHIFFRTALAGVALLGLSTLAAAKDGPHHAGHSDALWNMLHKECVPNYSKTHNPKPCTMVVPRPGKNAPDRGFVVIKDKRGKSQYLLLPMEKITGIEDAKLLAPGQINYFASAWVLAGYMFHKHAGKKATEDYTSVAVNSEYARSQNQLHLHVDCLSAKAHADLAKIAPQLSAKWSKKTYSISGAPFYVMYLKAKNIAGVQPFEKLAKDMPGAAKHMGQWSLAVAGASKGGFYVLATKADLNKKGNARGGYAEVVQDHSCRIP